ncbi:hypothetical protein HPB51_008669 [Rhipicephalus microplus]|uniref:Uncharacterized protein n=1 Tax=Rhipicephalus microplus TaxID=6941 RepID=A0A9J6E8Y9_RHIMP|nr:hypothetical protein HPB51_008669 [Rhipicephalus microplus]
MALRDMHCIWLGHWETRGLTEPRITARNGTGGLGALLSPFRRTEYATPAVLCQELSPDCPVGTSCAKHATSSAWTPAEVPSTASSSFERRTLTGETFRWRICSGARFNQSQAEVASARCGMFCMLGR